MALPKLFQRIFWHNNTTPAINEDNLNAMSKAIDDIDNRVIALGDDVMTVVPQIAAYLEQAEDLVEAMELLSENPPYIGSNGNWYVWDTNTSSFVDSGVDASITVDIADITMLAPDATPYVTNTGTATDPVFHLFIPRGETGNGISTIAKTGTSGLVDTYTITMTNGTTSTFTVTNGAGDMNKSVYDPTNAIANAGGMKSAAAKDSTNAVTQNSTNLVESGAVYTEVNSVKTALANNVNNNGSKNRCPFDLDEMVKINTAGTWSGNAYTYRGITYTIYDDHVNVNGTCNATNNSGIKFAKNMSIAANTYMLDGGANSSSNCYMLADLYNGSTHTYKKALTSSGVECVIGSSDTIASLEIEVVKNKTINNIDIYPMLFLKSDYDIDPTYQPFAETNKELTDNKVSWDDYNEAGAANLFNNTATTTTVNGVTFTVNDDKSITVNSTNGATTDYTPFQIKFKVAKTGQYKVLLDKTGTSASDCYYTLESIAPSTSQRITRSFDGNEIVTLTAGTQYAFTIYCRQSVPISNKVIYLFYTTLLDYNGPYVPYAMTNRELTEELSVVTDTIGVSVTTSEALFKHVVKYGKVVVANLVIKVSEAINGWTTFATIPDGFRPNTYIQVVGIKGDYTSFRNIQIDPQGNIQSATSVSSGEFIRFSATWITS